VGGQIDRRTATGLAAGAAVVAIVVAGNFVSSTGFPLAALVVAPVITAVFAGVGATALVGLVAIATSIVIAPRTSGYVSSPHVTRTIAVMAGSAVAVWLARIRTEHEREISSSHELVALAGELRATVGRLDALLERAPASFAFFELDGTIARVNESFAALFGYEPEEITGQRIADAIPHIWVRVKPLFDRVRTTGEPLVDVEVSGTTPREPHLEHHWLASIFPVQVDRAGEQGLLGLGALVVDITERKRAEEEIELLGRASGLFAIDLSPAEALEQVARLALPRFADACILYLTTADPAGRRATVAHRDPDSEAELRDLAAVLPARRPDGATARAMRTGEIEYVAEVTDEQRRRGASDETHLRFVEALDARSAITVPLALGERRIGAVTLLFTGHSNRRYRSDDVPVAKELGRRIAQVLDNVRLAQEAARATARLQLLARVGELLKIELDSRQRLQSIAQIMLPEFADGSAVYLLENGRLDLVAAGHPDPAVQEALANSQLPSHGINDAVAPCEAVRSGRAVLRASLTRAEADELTSGVRVRDPAAGRRPLVSYLAVPLVGSDGPIGALGFGYSFSGRTYEDDDIPIAMELARRVAPAVENARRYEDDREMIEVLQRTLLPAALPSVPGITVASRYLPGAEGLRIGGDWYDALVLSDGRLFLAIGDVVGHGVRAASSMGRLRNALEIYAVEHRSPADMLATLNRHFSGLADADMATVGVLVYEPKAGTAQFATAGHPPPLVREPDGSVRYLEPPRGMPICASPRAQYEETTAALAPGSTLVLYTDGLVERRHEPLDAGLARLAGAAASAPPDVEGFADHITECMLPDDQRNDDVAVLVVRFDTALDAFSMELGANPRELAALRRAIGEWAERAGASAVTREDVVLAVNEAVANAMEHAYGPFDARVLVQASVQQPGALQVRVRDFGRWRAGRPDDGGGRGLTLIKNLMDDVTVDTTPDGTVVQMTRALRSVPEPPA
jgi:PAS domain S-box-containing protein